MAPKLAFDEGVRSILRDAGLGDVGEIRPLTGGLVNTVYAVDRRWVVKIGTGPDGALFPKAADVMRAVAGRVAAPELVAVDFSHERIPANVMVCGFVEGSRLTSLWPDATTAERRRLALAVAHELEALHGVPPDAVECFRGLAPWHERLEERVRAVLARSRAAGTFELERLARMEAYLDSHRAALKRGGPEVLIHYDVWWENVIVRDGEVVALLDFDDAERAPVERDVWELLFAVGAADAPDAPLYGVEEVYGSAMRRAGAYERFAIGEIEEVLKLATDELGWISRASARVEADQAYRRTFESDFYRRLLSRVTGRPP